MSQPVQQVTICVLGESKSETGLLHGFSKVLALDGHVTDGEDVLRDKALHRPSTILDGELGAVRLVSRGRRRIILGMKEAGDGSALGARDPEVARAVIKG